MGRYDHAVPIVRHCSVCKRILPAGMVFHVPECRDIHKAQIDAKLAERRRIRRETGQ